MIQPFAAMLMYVGLNPVSRLCKLTDKRTDVTVA